MNENVLNRLGRDESRRARPEVMGTARRRLHSQASNHQERFSSVRFAEDEPEGCENGHQTPWSRDGAR